MPRNLNNINQTNGYTIIKPQIPKEWSSMYMAKTNQGTGDCGKIIPVFIKELMPNQKIDMSQDIAIQFTPFVSNLFHEITGEIITYFVPYRICAFMRPTENFGGEIEGETIADIREEADQLKWEAYITGGMTGTANITLEQVSLGQVHDNMTSIIGSLVDYFGMPTHVSNSESENNFANKLPFNAYNLIYNTKLRNPDFTPWKKMKVSTNSDYDDVYGTATAYWNSDRFTHARKWQQRGIVPSIPVTNELIELAHKITSENIKDETNARNNLATISNAGLENNEAGITITTNNNNKATFTQFGADTAGGTATGIYGNKSEITIDKHQIPAGALGVSIDYNEFLYNLAILKMEVNNARMKPRYTEFLKFRYGIFPQDARFNEPEHISSHSFNLGIDTTTSNGNTQVTIGDKPYTSVQGQITSQMWGNGQGMKSEFTAQEHGIIMSLMIIKPKGVYEGGLDRHWWGDRTKLDFPTPELMNTPDQKIWKGELHFTGVKDDDKELFAWEAIYDQDRTMMNQVCGKLRPSENNGLKSYTLARYFETAPEMNDEFIKCNPAMDRIKQYTSEPDFIFFHRTEIKTALPMPLINEPIDIGM